MSGRWLRLYDDTINNPKILSLPEAVRWHWVAVLCIASKHEGVLPSTDHVAIYLRMTKQKAAAIIAQLVTAKLLDKTETGFTPHDWNGRQYKSDVSTDRVKRFRNAKRNVECNVSETPPETETETETDSEAKASSAERDPRSRLFAEGLAKFAEMTGRGPDRCRSFIGKCLAAASDDAVVVLALIEEAEVNRVADPASWISARLKARGDVNANGLSQNRTNTAAERATADEIDGTSRMVGAAMSWFKERSPSGAGRQTSSGPDFARDINPDRRRAGGH